MDYAIRPARPSDIPGIKSVTKDADLFPPDMLDAMIAGYMGQTNGDIWIRPGCRWAGGRVWLLRTGAHGKWDIE